LLSPELAELASVPAIGRSVRWLRRSDVASTLEKDEIQTDRQTANRCFTLSSFPPWLQASEIIDSKAVVQREKVDCLAVAATSNGYGLRTAKHQRPLATTLTDANCSSW